MDVTAKKEELNFFFFWYGTISLEEEFLFEMEYLDLMEILLYSY